ncbi:MAG TPA: methyltransferase domain-containing protein [Moorella mulderi]|nr:methyltransferase domain-containing protein [Moorella mulderi]
MVFPFEKWASLYSSPFNEQFYQDIAATLLGKIKGHPRSILEVGAGTGAATELLQRRYPEASIIATEPVEEMLKYCQKRALPGVRLLPLSAGELAFLGSRFDLVLGNICYHWFPRGTLKILRDILAPQGQLALSIPIQVREKADGNLILLEVARKIKGVNRPGKLKTLAQLRREFSPLFSSLWIEAHSVEESHPPERLTLLLRVRGSFHFLFGEKGAEAEKMFLEMASAHKQINFRWNFALVVARP